MTFIAVDRVTLLVDSADEQMAEIAGQGVELARLFGLPLRMIGTVEGQAHGNRLGQIWRDRHATSTMPGLPQMEVMSWDQVRRESNDPRSVLIVRVAEFSSMLERLASSPAAHILQMARGPLIVHVSRGNSTPHNSGGSILGGVEPFRVVVGIDGSPSGYRALEMALALTDRCSTTISAAQVLTPAAMRRGGEEEKVARMARHHGKQVQFIRITSSTVQTGLEQVMEEGNHLLVISRFGRSGDRGALLGSQAARIIGRSSYPVLLN